MSTNQYTGLFKTFISSFAGDFISTFDLKKIDGIVTKKEYQAVMNSKERDFAAFSGVSDWNGNENNTTGYNDLVDAFWNSMDIDFGDGKIAGTNHFNFNAIDQAEVDKVNFLNIKDFADLLAGLEKYVNTYSCLLAKLEESKEAPNKKGLLNQIIVANNAELIIAMKEDVLAMTLNSKEYNSYNIKDYYSIMNDSTLANVIRDKTNISDMTDKQGVLNYFNKLKIKNPEIDKYFDLNEKYDSANNYQKASMQKKLYDNVLKTIDTHYPNVKNCKVDYITVVKDTVVNFVNEYLNENTLSGTANEVYKNSLLVSFNSGKGQALYDYLYTLSLHNINAKDYPNAPMIKDVEGIEARCFEQYLYDYLADKGCSNPKVVVDWMTNHDANSSKYQALVQRVANQILKEGANLTLDAIHERLCRALTSEILTDENIKEIIGVEEEEEIEDGNDVENDNTVENDETEDEEKLLMPSDGWEIETVLIENDKYGYHNDHLQSVLNLTRSKLQNQLDALKFWLTELGFDEDILKTALENVYSVYNTKMDEISVKNWQQSGELNDYCYHLFSHYNSSVNGIEDIADLDEYAIYLMVNNGGSDRPAWYRSIIDGRVLKKHIIEEYNFLLTGERTGGTTSERR